MKRIRLFSQFNSCSFSSSKIVFILPESTRVHQMVLLPLNSHLENYLQYWKDFSIILPGQLLTSQEALSHLALLCTLVFAVRPNVFILQFQRSSFGWDWHVLVGQHKWVRLSLGLVKGEALVFYINRTNLS